MLLSCSLLRHPRLRSAQLQPVAAQLVHASTFKDAPVDSQKETNVDDSVMGMASITSVTRKLWLERLSRREDKEKLHHLPISAPKARPPATIAVTYPLQTDRYLQEQYRNPWGQVRIGKLLEDLDSLAGNIAFEHCDDKAENTQLPTLVTVAVDAIHLRRRLDLDKNFEMSGQVVWTGKSSMDIRMQLTQGQAEPSLVALFTFVSRGPTANTPVEVNAVQPKTGEEKKWFQERQEVADLRRKARTASPSQQQPGSAARQQQAAALLAEARALIDMPSLAAGEALLMRDTNMQNTFVCQPQQRNINSKIFGGFLLRRAYELAFASAYMFAGAKPIFKEIDEVAFKRPVEIGDLLRFRSCIMHTEPSADDPNKTTLLTEVVASVAQPEQVSSNVSNTFTFVFEVDRVHVNNRDRRQNPSQMVKRVLPATEEEVQKIVERVQSGS